MNFYKLYKEDAMKKIMIIGATGYASQQLISILLRHNRIKIEYLVSHTSSGKLFSDVIKKFTGATSLRLISLDEANKFINNVDLVFLALPHGKSMNIIKNFININPNIKIIDLGSDFRLKEIENYKKWYGFENNNFDILKKFNYVIPEINRDSLTSNFISNPGCYPTSILLGIAPILKEIKNIKNIFINSTSGITGAGRKAKLENIFSEFENSMLVYGLGTHRHIAEIEEEIKILFNQDIQIQFTPSVIPISRGIISVITVPYTEIKNSDINLNNISKIYKEFYKNEHFVLITDEIYPLKTVTNTNNVLIYPYFDKRTNNIIIISMIDNLIKGASGQAVQNMNILFRFKENEGLNFNITV